MKVDVQAVEAELARIQRELTHSEVRTSLFNLVVHSSDVHRAQADDALTYLLGKRAARVIHVVNDTVSASSLEVSARCTIDEQRKGVCFQEIVIKNGRDGAGGALGSWTPLLVRDIPTYVLWLDAVSGHEELFENVQTQVDKLIIDSDRAIDLGDDGLSLLRTLRRVVVEQSVPLADFAWKRLLPFRRLAANAFAADPARLSGIDSVELSGFSQNSGRLFGLWLAERLGWSSPHLSPGEDRFSTVDGRSVALRCEAGEPGCDRRARFLLTDGKSVEVLTTESGCADITFEEDHEELNLLEIPGAGEILLGEVDAVYADSLYQAALALIAGDTGAL